MQALLAAAPVEEWWYDLPLWEQIVFVGIILLLLILLLIFGYKIRRGARITGFGPHAVKTTTTFEYDYAAASKNVSDPEKKAQPTKQTINDGRAG